MSLTPFLHFPTFFYKLRYDFRTIKGCHKIEAIRMRPQAFRNFQGDLNASPLAGPVQEQGAHVLPEPRRLCVAGEL